MVEARNTSLVALRDARERIVEHLGQRYAEDVLSLEDYERRVEVAQAATRVEELEILVADLEPETQSTALAPTTPVAMVPADAAPAKSSVVSVLGSASRKGTWVPPRELKAVAVLGETEVDFRSARMAPGPTVVKAVAVLGEITIVVPPGLRVDVQGSIDCDIEDAAASAAQTEGLSPSLAIEGVAVLGEITVTSRLPGESRRAARKRRKRERKRRKELGRAD